MMNFDEVNTEQVDLKTRLCQYDKPSAKSTTESQPKFYTKPLSLPNGTLQIPQPKVKVIPKIHKVLLHRNFACAKVSHTYSIVDDLV